MGSPRQPRFIARTDVADTNIGTTQPSPIIVSNEFAVGDMLLHRLLVELAGSLALTASASGTIIERGGLQFLRSLRFETDKHGVVVDGLDGIMLHVINAIRNRARPFNDDIDNAGTGTPAFAYGLELPFSDPDAARPEDSALDLYQSRPTLTCQYGIATDFISGGTYTTEEVASYIQEVHGDYDPGPIAVVKDGPLAMPYYGVRREPISQTESQRQILLTYGDRNIRRLYICQRNGSTLAELDNTVLGAAATDRLTLKVNGFPWVDRLSVRALQRANAAEARLAAVPTGVVYFDFTPRKASGFKYSDALSVVSQRIGNIELFADVTSVSNGQLWLGYEALKPLPVQAVRPAPAAAGA